MQLTHYRKETCNFSENSKNIALWISICCLRGLILVHFKIAEQKALLWGAAGLLVYRHWNFTTCHLRCQTLCPGYITVHSWWAGLLRVMDNLCGNIWFFFLQLFLLNKFCKVLTLKLTTKELFMQVAVTVYIKREICAIKIRHLGYLWLFAMHVRVTHPDSLAIIFL